jgi:hypothetical protein
MSVARLGKRKACTFLSESPLEQPAAGTLRKRRKEDAVHVLASTANDSASNVAPAVMKERDTYSGVGDRVHYVEDLNQRCCTDIADHVALVGNSLTGSLDDSHKHKNAAVARVHLVTDWEPADCNVAEEMDLEATHENCYDGRWDMSGADVAK